ncbi:hypothetical protein D9M71_445650 [compost metagenome]
MIAQCAQTQKQPGAVRLFGAAQGDQGLGHLLASGKGARIVLLTQYLVGTLDQCLGTADVLQGGQSQAGQTQQVLGLGQTPVLATGAEYGFQTLVQTLLITLQLDHQATACFQLIGGRQLRQACAQALLIELEVLRLVIQRLHLAQLLLIIGLQVTHLPDTPTAHRYTGRTQQQRDDCQTIASTLLGSRWWRRHFINRCINRCIKHRSRVIFRQGCFAHVSILCIRKRVRDAPVTPSARPRHWRHDNPQLFWPRRHAPARQPWGLVQTTATAPIAARHRRPIDAGAQNLVHC